MPRIRTRHKKGIKISHYCGSPIIERDTFKEGYIFGKNETNAKWKQAVQKFFDKFHKLVEVNSSEYGDPVVMSGVKNDFCAIKEYWRLENELRNFGGLAE